MSLFSQIAVERTLSSFTAMNSSGYTIGQSNLAASNIQTSFFFLSTTCTVNENSWDNLWLDLEGTKDFNDDHGEEITDFVQSIPGFQECDEEGVETWMACDAEDCGFQMLNDDEIVTSVKEESDPVNDETDEDVDNNNESSKGASNVDAFSALKTAIEWYEQSQCCPTELLLLKRIRDLAAKKRRCTMVQRKI
ncbi:hypothetical protein TNCV_1076471 [Trichonephila clavipes]|uniref:Uncharacterized protein n=1 Tax=Trichonephila clavipes TaxID=2585209 RepID=A0A8X6UY61_TRICX|nr:hypothetical protein TNCV_1076471 [Trichonephila clavipes]